VKAQRLPSRQVLPATGLRLSYEWVVILLMLLVPTAGILLYGGVHTWVVAPLLSLVFVSTILVALRPLVFAEIKEARPPPGALGWGVVILYACCLWPLSGIPSQARMEVLRAVSFVAAFWVWVEMSSSRFRRRLFLAVILFVVTLVSWYAVIQHGQGDPGVLLRQRPEVYGMRASGTYICPNHFASLVALLIPVSLALLLSRQAGGALRCLAFYSLLLFFPVLYLSQSRSGWLGAFSGITVTLWLCAFRKSKRLFVKSLFVVPAVGVFLGIAIWSASPLVRERVQGALIDNPDDAVLVRLYMWKDTLQMIQDHPFLGSGLGSYAWLYKKYQTNNLQFWFDYAHNEYLQLVAEYGLIGLVLFGSLAIGLIFYALRILGRCARDSDAFLLAGVLGGIAACMVHALFDFNLHIFSICHVLILLVGVVVGGLYSSGEIEPCIVRTKRYRFVAAGTSAILAVSTLLVVKIFVADQCVQRAKQSREVLAWDRALALYDKALLFDNDSWKAHVEKGHLLSSQSFWTLDKKMKREKAGLAKASYEEAVRANPYDMGAHLGLARLYSKEGDPDSALAQIDQILEYAHHDFLYLVQVGIRLRKMGYPARALEVFQQAGQIDTSETLKLNLLEVQKALAAMPLSN